MPSLLTIHDDCLRKIVDACHPLELTHLFVVCKHMRDIIISSGRVAYRAARSIVCINTTPTTDFLVQTYQYDSATDKCGIKKAIDVLIYIMQRGIVLPAYVPAAAKAEVMNDSHYRDQAWDIIRRLAKGEHVFRDVELSGVKLTWSEVKRIRTKYLVHKQKCNPATEKTMTKGRIQKMFKKMPKTAPFPKKM